MAGVLKGDIYYVDFGTNKYPSREQQGFRPGLVVSSDFANKNLPVVTIAPITSKIKAFSSSFSMILESGEPLISRSEVLLFQLRAFDQRKLKKKLGEIDSSKLEELNFILSSIFDT